MHSNKTGLKSKSTILSMFLALAQEVHTNKAFHASSEKSHAGKRRYTSLWRADSGKAERRQERGAPGQRKGRQQASGKQEVG